MNFKLEIKTLLLLAAILTAAFALSAQSRQVELSPNPNRAALRNNSDLGFDVNYTVGELKIMEVQTKEGTFDELSIEGWGFSTEVGEPKLPMLRRMISVPLGAEVRLTLNSPQMRELDSKVSTLQNRIIPAQAPISKAATTIPFVVNEALYRKDAFNSREWVEISELGFMRGVRLFALDFYPVRYNPVTNSIRVLENLDLRVDFVNPDLGATADLQARTASWEFERLYANTIFNWDTTNRTALVRQPTKMVILCPVGYINNVNLQNYVTWKTEQGFAVSVVSVGSGGNVANTTTAIKNYMQNLWNNATPQNPAPTYLLIIGDESGTNSIVTNIGTTNNTSHATDLHYVRLSGGDFMPEMYHGRFSVSSATELANIINKTITFEKTQMPDLSYLGMTVLIAGVDSQNAPTFGNGAIRYADTEYFNDDHGIISNTYLYPDSQNRAADIRANANEGRGYMVYTAHGSETSWYNPSFTTNHVNAMTNSDKYGVMVGNCCVTNKFNYSSAPCFGEAVIRKADGGGVAYIGGTNNTYWYEDYYWAVGYKTNINGQAPAYDATKLGAYDAMFHTHGEPYSKWATTVGETVYSGNLAVQQSGSDITDYYWEIYHIMGDPSLMPYLGVPTANPATYPAQITIGQPSYAITGAAPYTRVGLSMNGTIYGTGMTDASGNLNLTIDPFTTPGTAKLVLTAQNRITEMADIDVVSSGGPYMSVSAIAYDDANNNIPEYNESGYLDVTFENVGNQTATNVSAALSCSTPGITITDANHTISSLAAGASVLADDAFAISIADNVANGTVANFTITMTMSGHNPWTYNFTLTLNAPELAFGELTIDDSAKSNGCLDPGETVTVIMPLSNSGGAASPGGTATLNCSATGITVNNGTVNFNAIPAGGNTNLSFTVTADASMPQGSLVDFVFNATAGQYTANITKNVEVGSPPEVVIGNGTSSYYYPLNRYHNYSGHEAIYLASEIGTAGTIKSIGYYKDSGSDTNVIEAVTVYMKNTSSSTLATGSHSTAGYTQVYSGTWPNTATSGWMEVDLDNQFPHDGTNLSILIIKGYQYWTNGYPRWTYTTTSSNRARQSGSDYSQPTSLTATTNLPNLKLKIFPAPGQLHPPRNLSATPGNGYVNLSWEAPLSGTPTGYRIYRDGSLLTTVTGLTHTDNTVVNETTYSYYVVAAYSDGVSDPSNTVQATPTVAIIIGTGTSSNGTTAACPVNVYYQSLHGQSVYTKTELNAAGVIGPIYITQIGFNITGLPTKAMPDFIVRMGHTAASNVANWISSGLTRVWSSASFQPTATGWNMYTLSTPFYWDGNQNIVVDTAFSQIGSYSSSGTTQYTAVTNGYRFTRLDSADQTDVFSGGYISEQRPNLRLITQAIPSGPMIMVNPTSLEYGDVAVGNTEVQTFTIQNVGNQTLTGTITTPAGYTVAESGRFAKVHTTGKESRNSLAFSINAGASKTYNLSFAPSEAIAYNGNVVIANNSSNDPNVNIAVSGMGYIPPIISIDNNALSANLRVDTQGTDSFTITNSGSKPLTFNIGMERQNSKAHGKTQAVTDQGKSIAGSTLTLDATDYLPGTTVDLTFTVYNGSTDNEWLTDVIITFPAGVTVNSVTDFVGGTGGPLTPDVSSGNGVAITWHGVNSYGNGYIHMNESATATVNVSIASSFSGSLTLPWTINGDNYLAEPHTLSGSIVLLENIPWLSVAPLSGTLAAGASTTITATFSAVGMAVGTYQALLTIHSNDPVNPSLNVNATMDVWVPDIITDVIYEASNVTGATFVSNHDLFIVPGVDENTPAMADLPNLDPATSHIAGYTGGDNNVTLTFTISTAGDWYLMGYWGGSWHQATPFPLTVSSGSGTVTLSGIDFTAKGDVYVVLSPDNNPTLPVELSHFSATLTAENYVQLTWTSQTESNLLGYNVYRNDASDLSSALKVSELIEGTNTSIAQTYIYVDEELQQDGTYYYWLQNVDMDGKVGFHGPASVVYSTGGGPGAPPIPLVTKLENAYPNPFNPDTTIRYQLKDPAQVRIDIYNLKGQIVRSFSQSHDAPGYYQLNWDGCDSSGRALSSGVYL